MTGLVAVAPPSAYWYATRGTGVVALLLLSAGMVLGALGPVGWDSSRLPRFLVAGLHRSVTLLAVAFVAVHVVTTVADGFAPIGLQDAVLPFASPYRPVWLGLGAVAFDLLLALVVTSLLRRRLGLRAWRLVHWLAYAAWPVALIHGLGTGSDAPLRWLEVVSAGCAAAVALALTRRLVAARVPPGRRLVAAGAAAVALVTGAAWYRSGPLATGWARRAGTPSALLRASRQAPAVRRAATGRLPAPPFDGRLVGRFAQAGPDGRGLVSVAVAAIARGAAHAQLRLDLWGTPLADGGIELRASSATFGPPGAARAYTGEVVGLSGSRVIVGLRNARGRVLELALDMRLDPRTGSVGGTLSASAAQGGAASRPGAGDDGDDA